MIFNYPSKKVMKESVGERLKFTETSMFGSEYPNGGTGTMAGSNRPHMTGFKREFFAEVVIENHMIVKVS